MVQFLCPCDQVPVEFPDEEIGRMVRCPYSGAIFRVPAPAPSSPPPALLRTPQAWDLLERLAGPALGGWRAGGPWRTGGAAPVVPDVSPLLQELCARGSDRKRRLFACGLCRLKCPQLR